MPQYLRVSCAHTKLFHFTLFISYNGIILGVGNDMPWALLKSYLVTVEKGAMVNYHNFKNRFQISVSTE